MSGMVEPMRHEGRRKRRHHLPTWLLGLYALLMTYLSLYPFDGWRWPEPEVWDPLVGDYPFWFTRVDLFTNVALYLPLGALLVWTLAARLRLRWAVPLAVLTGLTASVAFEVGQAFLPSRVPTILDVSCNTAGAVLGAAAAAVVAAHPGVRNHHHDRWLTHDGLTVVSLLVPLLWALSQLTPLAPSRDPAELAAGLAPLAAAVADPARLRLDLAGGFALSVLGLGLVVATAMPGRRPPLRLYPVLTLFVISVLALKVPIVARQLSLEAAVGAVAALLLLPLVAARGTRLSSLTGFLVLGAFIVIQGLHADTGWLGGEELAPWNWIPFKSHLATVGGLGDLLAKAWPYLGLGILGRRLTGPRDRGSVALLGGIAILILALALEWVQQDLPGGRGDVTDAVTALLAWTIPWWVGRGGD